MLLVIMQVTPEDRMLDFTGTREATTAEYEHARRNVPSRAWRTLLFQRSSSNPDGKDGTGCGAARGRMRVGLSSGDDPVIGVARSRQQRRRTPLLRARVLGVYAMEGQYGVTTIVRMQAASATADVAHDLCWFAAGSPQVVTDGGKAAAALDAAQQAEYTARQAQDTWHRDHGYSECPELFDLRGAWLDAYHAVQAAEKAIQVVTRAIQPGDLVDVTGSIKEHRVSEKTRRAETVLTRCSLALVVEQLEAK